MTTVEGHARMIHTIFFSTGQTVSDRKKFEAGLELSILKKRLLQRAIKLSFSNK